MRSLLRLSAIALMGLGFIAAVPGQAQAQTVQVGWYAQPTYYGYAPPPPRAYYGGPRYYAPQVYVPPVYAPPPVYFAPRPRFYGPPPWAHRHHHHGRRW